MAGRCAIRHRPILARATDQHQIPITNAMRASKILSAKSSYTPIRRHFQSRWKTITLYRHQAQAVAKAAQGTSFVVTTGTGSGKSLCFFIPIIDAG